MILEAVINKAVALMFFSMLMFYLNNLPQCLHNFVAESSKRPIGLFLREETQKKATTAKKLCQFIFSQLSYISPKHFFLKMLKS